MAEYSENMIKFGWLTKAEMLEAIEDGKLDAYDLCYLKDTHEQMLISSSLEPVPIKSRVRIFGSVDSAIADINQTPQTYEGEILSIRDGDDKFIAYIVNKFTDGTYYVTPVYSDSQIDYNGLSNVPIKNLEGTLAEPIVVSSLDTGFYKIVGRYTAPDNEAVNSYVGDFIVVEQTGLHEKSIKRITSTSVFDYVVTDTTVTKDRYATEQYVKDQGYATEDYVSTEIAALQATMEEYIREYVETTCTLLIKHLIDEELDARYAVKDDIDALFS